MTCRYTNYLNQSSFCLFINIIVLEIIFFDMRQTNYIYFA